MHIYVGTVCIRADKQSDGFLNSPQRVGAAFGSLFQCNENSCIEILGQLTPTRDVVWASNKQFPWWYNGAGRSIPSAMLKQRTARSLGHETLDDQPRVVTVCITHAEEPPRG